MNAEGAFLLMSWVVDYFQVLLINNGQSEL